MQKQLAQLFPKWGPARLSGHKDIPALAAKVFRKPIQLSAFPRSVYPFEGNKFRIFILYIRHIV